MGFSFTTFISGAILSVTLLVYGKYLDRQKRKRDFKNELCALIDQYLRKITSIKQSEMTYFFYARQFELTKIPKKEELKYEYFKKSNDTGNDLVYLKSEMLRKISQLKEFTFVNNIDTIEKIFQDFHGISIAQGDDIFAQVEPEILDMFFTHSFSKLSDRVLDSKIGSNLTQIQKLIYPNYFNYKITVDKEERVIKI